MKFMVSDVMSVQLELERCYTHGQPSTVKHYTAGRVLTLTITLTLTLTLTLSLSLTLL